MDMFISTKFSSLAASEVVNMTISGAANDKKKCQNDDIYQSSQLLKFHQNQNISISVSNSYSSIR